MYVYRWANDSLKEIFYFLSKIGPDSASIVYHEKRIVFECIQPVGRKKRVHLKQIIVGVNKQWFVGLQLCVEWSFYSKEITTADDNNDAIDRELFFYLA
jgi:hypothetical protein